MPLRRNTLWAATRLNHEPGQRSLACQFLLARGFHASRNLGGDKSLDHYATLNVRPDASAGEIKKSFYHLSKTHHPDHNRSDPTSGRRFMRISEAYSILGNADKRARYDRDAMRHQPPPTRPASYASTGPAGGRPASGLSRRRGTFQGPPPSFFRSGGWGAHGAKRRAAQHETAGASGVGGMGFGHNPHRHRDDVRHFDRDAHERTQRRIEQEAARRRRSRERPAGFFPDSGILGNFLTVTGVLVVAIAGPFLAFEAWAGTSNGRKPR